MASPDMWVYLLPVLYSGIWGAQAWVNPTDTFNIGPADQQIVGGAGQVIKANNERENGSVEGTLAYTYGGKAFNLQPKLTAFVTARGDLLTGVGVQDDMVFKNISLTPDGASPMFFSWSVGPALYFPGPRPNANPGSTLQFQMTDEVGFYLGKSLRVSVAYNHYSNGGFVSPNPDGNAFTFNVGYRF
jgi:hypothetical protein